jgi:prophage regulatory protein
MIKTAAGATVGTAPPHSRRFLRIRDVCEATGLRPSTLYAYVAAGKFPKQFRIGPRCAAWDEAEVLAWKAQCLSKREQVQAAA